MAQLGTNPTRSMTRIEPQRIVFIGAECTGKTTLTRAVAEHLEEPWSREFVREYVETVQRELRAEDLDAIAKGQIRGEDAAVAKARHRVLHDTNLLSTILYAEHYFDTHLAWVDRDFAQRRYHRYFLCEPDFPWQADPGQRESAEERARLQLCFESMLRRYDLSFVRVSGPLDQRITQVLRSLHVPPRG